VLIVSYEVRDILQRCLNSTTEADEVIVVDNASTDGTPEMIRQQFGQVLLVVNADNRGFSVATNQAARIATGDLLLLLNPDTQLWPGAIDAMRGEMLSRPDAAVLGFRQVNAMGTFQLSIGPRPSLVLELGRMITQRRLDRGDTRLARWLDRRYQKAMEVAWVSGSSLMVRRSAFSAIGGFDESFFLYFEDADFCLRARAQGRVYYVPTVTVMHHRGMSAAKNVSVAQRAYRSSQIIYWQRYRGRRHASLISLYQRVLAGLRSR
jgi:N-acetylglucosaminyl-diphospho-decaprenol L-rhamnosyltransferase